jgi:ABC-type sugar transport system permease subunit
MVSEQAISREESEALKGAPWWERNLAWLLVAPTVVMFILFAAIPAITTFTYAFSRVKMARGGVQTNWIGFENFIRAFQDPLVAQSAWTTIKWMVIVTTVEIGLGLALALLMTGEIRGRAR